MLENLAVSAWIGVRANCDISYCLNTEGDLDFWFDDGARRFEFAIETEALRKLVEVGSRALAEMEARQAAEATGHQPSGRHELAEKQ